MQSLNDSASAYPYFACFVLGIFEVIEQLKVVVACCRLQNLCDELSYLLCIRSVCDLLTALSHDTLWFQCCGRYSQNLRFSGDTNHGRWFQFFSFAFSTFFCYLSVFFVHVCFWLHNLENVEQ